MITITQFTLPQIRAAHDLVKAHRGAETASAASEASAPAQSTEEHATPPDPVDQADGTAEAQPAQQDGEPSETSTDTPSESQGPSQELIAKLVEATSVKEDKVQYLLGALDVAGNRIQQVRQIRVVQVEGAPTQAVKREEAAYILDMLPQANHGGDKDRGKGRDGDRKGSRGGRGNKGRGNEGKGQDRRGGPGAPGGKDRPQGGRGPGRAPGAPAAKRG